MKSQEIQNPQKSASMDLSMEDIMTKVGRSFRAFSSGAQGLICSLGAVIEGYGDFRFRV